MTTPSGRKVLSAPAQSTDQPAITVFGNQIVPRDIIIRIMTYGRATSLRAMACTCKAMSTSAGKQVWAEIVESLVKNVYGTTSPSLRQDDRSWTRDLDTLYLVELRHLNVLLQGQEPSEGGFWISKSWCTNYRRYVENMSRTLKFKRPALSSKAKRNRERTESNVMPPWPDVNGDIMCQHGALARSSQTRAKRRAIHSHTWEQIRLFFPEGREFQRCQGECIECHEQTFLAKKAATQVKQNRESEVALSELRALFTRKGGVPYCSTRPPEERTLQSPSPLKPGIYHMMPRCWLTAWRSYVRDPKAARPRLPEPSLLLCEGHGMFLLPPHVDEYLSGGRRNLLGNLDSDSSGCVCEIMTPEEWDALTLLYPCDFSVRFCVQPGLDYDHIAWNLQKCSKCDPRHIGHFYVTTVSRKLTF